jgi:hypothetical protein
MADAVVTSRGLGAQYKDIGVSTLAPLADNPSAVAGKAQVYAKTDSGVVEVYVMDSAGNPTKLSG